MKKIIGIILKTVAALAGIVLTVIVAFGIAFNTSKVQQRLLHTATAMLEERLLTRVVIDSIHIGLLNQDVYLYGLQVDDRQKRRMLQLDELSLDVDLLPLLSDEVCIRNATVRGLSAELHKDSTDSVANYQFVIDAFKKQKKDQREQKNKPQAGEKSHKKLVLNLNNVLVERIAVNFDDKHAQLDKITLKQQGETRRKGVLTGLRYDFTQRTKKGPVPTKLHLLSMHYDEKDGHRQVEIDSLRFITNNGKPRKNANKPKRGFFDVGHFNVLARLKADVDYMEKDSVHVVLQELTAQDPISGIDIRNIQCHAGIKNQIVHLQDVIVKQITTELHIDEAFLQLPSKKKGIPFTYRTGTIHGRAILKDISRPFAPVLRNFKLPLNLRCRMSGDKDGMQFSNIVVNTDDKQLHVTAKGYITNLKDKYQMKVHFDILSCVAKGTIKEKVINQFVVKKFMMKQLDALGTLNITGGFNVLWKREEFMANVRTALGNMSINFAIDENNKYLDGHVTTTNLHLGRVMDMPQLGPIAANADFHVDISKPRTAQMRRIKGGKLPICTVTATIDKCSYMGVSASDLKAKIESDGAVAEGYVYTTGKVADLSCQFSFTNTNEMKKTKIKPGIRFNLFGRGDDFETRLQKKKQKEAEKQQKAAEKAARKQQKAAEKAARKQKEAEEDALREQQKAAEKAARKAEKEARKQQKAAEKAARKAEKEARKAAERAAKEQQTD